MPTKLALAPSEIRSPAVEPWAGKRRPALLAMQVALGVACLIGFFVAARMLLAGSDPHQVEIRLGKIEDWPEIKNGVPDVVPARAMTSDPRPTSSAAPAARGEPPGSRELPARELVPASEGALPPTRSASSPSPEPVAADAMKAEAGAEAAMAQLRPSVPLPPTDLRPHEFAGLSQPAAPDMSVSPPTPPPDAGEASAEVAPTAASAPLPPRRPKELKAAPRPKQVASSGRGAIANAGEVGTAATPAASGAPADGEGASQDERVHLFGVPMPAFVPNARKIRGCLLEFRC
jgi:hypothetical protein